MSDPALSLAERVGRLEDLHAIQQLRARYCQALDDGRWDDLVELFTQDGEFVGLSTVKGRTELREFFANLQGGLLSAWWHFSSNETIELIGSPATHATGQTWLDQPCVVDGVAHIAAGRYSDELTKGADGAWRFSRRQVSFFFWAPTSVGWEPGRYAWPPAGAAADSRTVERLHGTRAPARPTTPE